MVDLGVPLGLNPQQEQAVRHPGGPLMVLAGAGSGKTRVLVHRIAELVRSGVPAHRILAVTFTNKAAGEMRERLVSMLGYDARAMWISTFHSTCAKLLRIHHDRVGLTRNFAIYDDDDQKKVLNAILKEEGLSDSVTPRTVQVFIDRAKNKGQDPMDQFTGNYADDILRQVYPLYRDRLAREDAVDFNDLLLKVVELCKHKEAGKTLAEMFDHVLVDEFQDTNLVQYELVRHFVRLTRNLTVVGDDDQSIYSWRGAEPRNLLDFDRDFRDATAVRLEQNYRSSGMILAAANSVISRNFDRHEKTLWTERDTGEPILWEESADERGEADFVARAIQGLISDDGRSLGDFAILYRTHAQSRILEEMMRAHALPYRIVGGVSFFQRKEVKDIRSYLRLVVNPQADLAFERIVNVPTRGIGKTTVERLRSFAKQHGVSLLEASKAAAGGKISTIKGAASKKLAAFVSLIQGLGDVVNAGASVAEVIIQAVERSTYRSRLEQEDTPEARDRLQNLSELVNMASDFDDETDGEGTLSEFDERISLASVSDQEDGRGTSVTLMTIHAAKGLEFPIVFVCGMEDGLFPSLRERDFEQDKAIEEERRLAYVAFTRAEDRLILTSTRARRVWNELKLNRPSRFVDEIPSECLAVRERPQMPQDSYRERLQAHRRDSSDEFAEPDYDFDQSTYYDDVPDFDVGDADEDGDFSAGSTVRHSTFGSGRVIESQGAGRDQKLLINFPSVGLKKVLARFVTR